MMKKELLWAACISALLGTGVLMLTGGGEPEGLPWAPLNEKLETALALQEGTLEQQTKPKAGEAGSVQPDTDEAKQPQNETKPIHVEEKAPIAKPKTGKPAEGDSGQGKSAAQEKTAESSTDNRTAQSAQAQSAAAGSSQASAETQAASVGEDAKRTAPVEDGRIHLNSADAAQLMELKGIGEKKAQAILDYRAKNGPFRDVTDLVKVKGIGPKMLEKMLPDLAL